MSARALLLALLTVAGCGFGDDHNRAVDLDGAGADDAGADGERDGATDGRVDAGPDAAPVACSLVPQGGCPAGRSCDLIGSSGDTTCREVAVAGTADDLCAGGAQCAVGWSCLATTGESSCLEFCEVDADCAPATGSRCAIIYEDGNGNPVPGGTFCTQACGLLNASGCPTGWNCIVLEDAAADATRCIPAGDAVQDDDCTTVDDCAIGYTCTNHDSARTCLRNCRVGVSGSCNAVPGASCTGFASPHVIASVEWGVCL